MKKVKKEVSDKVILECDYTFNEIQDEDVIHIVGVEKESSGCFMPTMTRDIEFEVNKNNVSRIKKDLILKFGKKIKIYVHEMEE